MPENMTKRQRTETMLLLGAAGTIAICGIIYELIIGAASSYMLGNSVKQFSITIGLFMSSMGLGSFISKKIKWNLIGKFILVEVGVGILGGISAMLLYAAFAIMSDTLAYSVVMYSLIISVGALIGIEVPILTRVLKEYGELRVVLADVLTWDYAGSLLGAIAFPLFLLPWVGLFRAAFIVGLLNIFVALIVLVVFYDRIHSRVKTIAVSVFGVLILGGGLVFAGPIQYSLEKTFYKYRISKSMDTAYQRIVLTEGAYRPADMGQLGGTSRRASYLHSWFKNHLNTFSIERRKIAILPEAKARIEAPKWENDLRLFLDRDLQFCSIDEYRYHEALVHIPLGLLDCRSEILLLGAGDGMAAREVLKYSDVRKITIVDIDPAIVEMCKTHPRLARLNKGSLQDPRVTIISGDAYAFVSKSSKFYNAIIIDLPDPDSTELATLYSREFYVLAASKLAPGGLIVTQASSPFYARTAFWCIVHTFESARLNAYPYRAVVPAFGGEWGFVLASVKPLIGKRPKITVPTRYLTNDLIPALFAFPADFGEVEAEPNSLVDAWITRYYEQAKWDVEDLPER